jgi:hypothetical protein
MPLLLLAAVYVPLRRALDEVAWQVRTRAAVQESLRREPHKIVQSRVRVERQEVDLLVVMLGKTEDAEASKARLDAEIRAASGTVPRIEVLAIPDATAFAGLESSLRTNAHPLPIPEVRPPQSPAQQLDKGRELVHASVLRVWPTTTVGEPLRVEVGTELEGPLRVQVVHLGAALGADAIEGLGRSLGIALARDVQLVDVALPVEPLSRSGGDLKFLSDVTAAVVASTAVASVRVCVVAPELPETKRAVDLRERELAAAVTDVLASHPRVDTSKGDDWEVRFAQACPGHSENVKNVTADGTPPTAR